MQPYLKNLEHTMTHGLLRTDRTGVGTYSVFGMEERYSLRDGSLPLVTTKKLHLKSIIHELLWMISGDTRVDYLINNGVSIWNDWVKPETAVYDENNKLIGGELGPVYSKQWRNIEDVRLINLTVGERLPVGFSEENRVGFYTNGQGEAIGVYKRSIDQLARLLHDLEYNPMSRRHIINAWHVPDLEAQALPPCHTLFQFYVRKDKISAKDMLSCKLYQRSADTFLGKPFNIAFYSILTHAIANQLGYEADEFIWSGGDCHVYTNHVDQVREQLSREPFEPARIKFSKPGLSILEMKYDDIEIEGYSSHPRITAPVAV